MMNFNNKKIISFEKLKLIIAKKKALGKKIVHCHGVFDLLHIGHIKHFREAKSLGDILIVTVTPDKYVQKGYDRPAFNLDTRLESLAELSIIDYVVANKWLTAIKAIKIIAPDTYCKGPDYRDTRSDITGKIKEEAKAVKLKGGRIHFTTDISFSSSKLVNKYISARSEQQKIFINNIVTKSNFTQIKDKIETMKKIKVLVIGETIIDQYVFSEALGKSGKEPVLVLRDLFMEQYIGGAAAIARHLSDFCNKITLVSILGEKGEYENFIKNNLPNNIVTKFLYKNNSPTIVKKRYVDYISNNKTFGVYSINDDVLNKKNEKELIKVLNNLIPKHDLVITSDYGHGFVTKSASKIITKKSSFVTLNAQINAANRGYHSIDKYQNIDCVIINESELRYQLRDKDKPIEKLMKELSSKIKIKYLIVTQGHKGSTLYNSYSGKVFFCPAFASKVIDKIGAGDSMLSLLSLALKNGHDENLSLYLGSLAASQSVETIGNSKSINKTIILKSIKHMLQ